jgi:hypothetical protein
MYAFGVGAIFSGDWWRFHCTHDFGSTWTLRRRDHSLFRCGHHWWSWPVLEVPIGALIVGLSRATAVHLVPVAELFSIYVVMAMVLMVRPEGLFQRIQARKNMSHPAGRLFP